MPRILVAAVALMAVAFAAQAQEAPGFDGPAGEKRRR